MREESRSSNHYKNRAIEVSGFFKVLGSIVPEDRYLDDQTELNYSFHIEETVHRCPLP